MLGPAHATCLASFSQDFVACGRFVLAPGIGFRREVYGLGVIRFMSRADIVYCAALNSHMPHLVFHIIFHVILFSSTCKSP